MPTRLTHLNPAVDGNTIWFAGGFKGRHPGPVTAEVWKYDIASDAWTAGPPLPERRAGGGLAVVGRKLHYFGGYKADRDTNAGDHWSLSLEGGKDWQREADLPDPRGHVSSAVLDGKIYALGGDHGHDVTQIDVKSCHRFDPATKKWSEIASLPRRTQPFRIEHDRPQGPDPGRRRAMQQLSTAAKRRGRLAAVRSPSEYVARRRRYAREAARSGCSDHFRTHRGHRRRVQ